MSHNSPMSRMRPTMKNKPKGIEIVLTLEGISGKVDGYLEVIFGIFVFAQVLLGRSRVFRVVKDGRSLLIVKLTLKNPPLGNLGESDTIDIDSYEPFSELENR